MLRSVHARKQAEGSKTYGHSQVTGEKPYQDCQYTEEATLSVLTVFENTTVGNVDLGSLIGNNYANARCQVQAFVSCTH